MSSWTSFAIALMLLLTGCGRNAPEHGIAPEPAQAFPPVSISLSEIQEMLKGELTVAQVQQRLGKPVLESDQAWGNLMYQLPEEKWLVFFFKGPYVTGARYDRTEIAGIPPTVHELFVKLEVADRKIVWYLEMDGRRFSDLAELGEYIQSFPRDALVEFQMNCMRISESQPLQTQQDREKLRQVCQDAGVILLLYPSG